MRRRRRRGAEQVGSSSQIDLMWVLIICFMAMVLGLLSGCELLGNGLPTVHQLHAVVCPAAVTTLLPTVYLAAMAGALVVLGCVAQRIFERRRHAFAGTTVR